MASSPQTHLSYLSSATVGAIWLAVSFSVLADAVHTHQSWRIITAAIGVLLPMVVLLVTASRWRRLSRQGTSS